VVEGGECDIGIPSVRSCSQKPLSNCVDEFSHGWCEKRPARTCRNQ
jgi:hypothetical protein